MIFEMEVTTFVLSVLIIRTLKHSFAVNDDFTQSLIVNACFKTVHFIYYIEIE